MKKKTQARTFLVMVKTSYWLYSLCLYLMAECLVLCGLVEREGGKGRECTCKQYELKDSSVLISLDNPSNTEN